MNPWLELLKSYGLPIAFLAIVLRFLWPLHLAFIDEIRKKLAVAEKRVESATEQLLESRKECQAEGKVMMTEFMSALDKRDDTGRMQVKQLEVLAETNRRLVQGAVPLKRKR